MGDVRAGEVRAGRGPVVVASTVEVSILVSAAPSLVQGADSK